EITAGLPSARLRFGDFFSRMWLVNGCRPRTLPVPVILKRFLAPECVFILGMIASRRLWHGRARGGARAILGAGPGARGPVLGGRLGHRRPLDLAAGDLSA